MRKAAIFVLTSMFLLVLVGAYGFSPDLERGSEGISRILISALGPFFAALLGGSREVLFEKILLFLIITSIVYMVIMKRIELFNDNKAIVAIVTFSISILATRYLLWTDLIYTIILPYSVLGVALSAFIPLLIAFFFIQQFSSGFLRKTFWVLFIVTFWAMWEIRYAEVGGISWIYFWSAIISLIFFLFDGTIRRAMLKQQMQEANIESHEQFAIRIRKELEELEKNRSAGHVSDEVYKKIKRRLSKQLKDLLKF